MHWLRGTGDGVRLWIEMLAYLSRKFSVALSDHLSGTGRAIAENQTDHLWRPATDRSEHESCSSTRFVAVVPNVQP